METEEGKPGLMPIPPRIVFDCGQEDVGVARELQQFPFVVRPHPVGGPGVIAEVDRRFGRQPAQDLAKNGEPDDARVEDADRSRIGHLTQRRAPAGTSPTFMSSDAMRITS